MGGGWGYLHHIKKLLKREGGGGGGYLHHIKKITQTGGGGGGGLPPPYKKNYSNGRGVGLPPPYKKITQTGGGGLPPPYKKITQMGGGWGYLHHIKKIICVVVFNMLCRILVQYIVFSL